MSEGLASFLLYGPLALALVLHVSASVWRVRRGDRVPSALAVLSLVSLTVSIFVLRSAGPGFTSTTLVGGLFVVVGVFLLVASAILEKDGPFRLDIGYFIALGLVLGLPILIAGFKL